MTTFSCILFLVRAGLKHRPILGHHPGLCGIRDPTLSIVINVLSSSSSLCQATRPIAQNTITNTKNTHKDRQENDRNKNIQTSYRHNVTRCFTIKLLQEFHRCRNLIRQYSVKASVLTKSESNSNCDYTQQHFQAPVIAITCCLINYNYKTKTIMFACKTLNVNNTTHIAQKPTLFIPKIHKMTDPSQCRGGAPSPHLTPSVYSMLYV